MFELKRINARAIPAAQEKAVRYRLLNEPMEAESICLDILELEPDNQEALITLVLALTDQFDRQLGERVRRAKEILSRIQGEYELLYYEGIICERQGKAHFKRGGPRSGHIAYSLLRRAMELYEQAQALSAPENEDAALRWNACARIIMSHPEIEPEPETPRQPVMLE